MKDHQIRELVNQLRDIAVKYHAAGQLRERIAHVIRAAMLQTGTFRGNVNSSTNNCREISETSTNSPEIPDCWISVSERLPPDNKPLIVSTACGIVQRAIYRFDNNARLWRDWAGDYDEVAFEMFTSWMLLPAPPRDDQGE